MPQKHCVYFTRPLLNSNIFEGSAAFGAGRRFNECHCSTSDRCAIGCVVECRICNREIAGSNLGLGYFAPRSTQPSVSRGSVNEYQL